MLIIYLIIAALVIFSGLDSQIWTKSSNRPRRRSTRSKIRPLARHSRPALQAQLGLASSQSSRISTARWWWE